MENKNWWESKVLWLGVLTSLISILEIFGEWYKAGDFSIPAITTFVIGILLVIVRVWFTNSVINK